MSKDIKLWHLNRLAGIYSTTDTREALQRALPYIKPTHPGDVQADADMRAVDLAIEALAAPQQAQEPVAWQRRNRGIISGEWSPWFATSKCQYESWETTKSSSFECRALYAHPPAATAGAVREIVSISIEPNGHFFFLSRATGAA